MPAMAPPPMELPLLGADVEAGVVMLADVAGDVAGDVAPGHVSGP